MRIGFYIVLVFFLTEFSVKAQNGSYKETLIVNGPSDEHLSEYATFWVDSLKNGTVSQVSRMLKSGHFQHWELGETLNLGANPYPTWLYLKVRNTSQLHHHYWWAVYSQADAVQVYENTNGDWILLTTVLGSTPQEQRDVKTRFPAAEIILKENQSKELLMKVVNPKHTQHAITDFTTPHSNLLWETGFFWNVGFFVGCFFLMGVLSILLSGISREKAFLFYGAYLLLIVCLILYEELMLPTMPAFFIKILRSLHPLFLSLIALSVHYELVKYMIGESPQEKVLKWQTLANKIMFVIGLVFLIVYAIFFGQMRFGFLLFDWMWETAIICVAFSMMNNLVMVVLSMKAKKMLFLGIVTAALLLYFNAAGYFMNYSGIFNYYTITYPNYFYWIVCAEMLCFATVLAWRYRKTVFNHLRLVKEKAVQEEMALLREVEIQNQERQTIARDLHDDLGTTISAIKLIVTNSYNEDEGLVGMIEKANNDIRQFFTKLTVPDAQKEQLTKIINTTIANLHRTGQLSFTFIKSGNEKAIPKQLLQPLSRMVVELMLNTAKHSKATECTVQLIIEKDHVQLMVEDNGKGFDIQKKPTGMGIDNIHSRAQRWGGDVHFSSSKTGTTVIIMLPFKANDYEQKL